MHWDQKSHYFLIGISTCALHSIIFKDLVLSSTHPAPNLKASGWVRRSSLLRIHRLFSELYSADLGWTVVKLIHGLGDLEMTLSHLQGNSSSRRHSLAHSALVSMLFT